LGGDLPTDEKLRSADICGQLLNQPQQKLAVWAAQTHCECCRSKNVYFLAVWEAMSVHVHVPVLFRWEVCAVQFCPRYCVRRPKPCFGQEITAFSNMSLMISVSTLMIYTGCPNTQTYRNKNQLYRQPVKLNTCSAFNTGTRTIQIWASYQHIRKKQSFGNHLSYLVVMPSGSWVMVISHVVCMLSMKL
jgi:hypothetical protein